MFRRLRQVAEWVSLVGSLLQPFSKSRSIEARRTIALRLLQGHAESITFQRDGTHWSSPIAGAVVRDLFLGNRHQEQSFALLSWLAVARPQPLIVNAGANIGDTAIALARAGRRVIAVEPVASTFAHLVANVAANRLADLIDCRHAAVASRPGEIQMAVHPDPGMCEVATAGEQGFGHRNGCPVESVAAVRLDSLAAASDVALVWSDTQGFEAEVIESGESFWAASVPLWVEVWPAGLAAHGGIGRFVAACRQHFTAFASAKALDRPQPVAALGSLIEQTRSFTDVLLLPRPLTPG